jgi:hypothetical protein
MIITSSGCQLSNLLTLSDYGTEVVFPYLSSLLLLRLHTINHFMNFETNTLAILVSALSSAGFGMIITSLALRKKNNAETLLFNTEIYSTMLGDLRAQLNLQGEQLKNQAEQILNLQKKENEYVKIIKNAQLREREYVSKIKNLEKSLKGTEELLKELQFKFQSN